MVLPEALARPHWVREVLGLAVRGLLPTFCFLFLCPLAALSCTPGFDEHPSRSDTDAHGLPHRAPHMHLVWILLPKYSKALALPACCGKAPPISLGEFCSSSGPPRLASQRFSSPCPSPLQDSLFSASSFSCSEVTSIPVRAKRPAPLPHLPGMPLLLPTLVRASAATGFPSLPRRQPQAS